MKILAFDSAYRLSYIKKFGLEHLVQSRSVNNLFTKVYSANYSSCLLNLRDKKYHGTLVYNLDRTCTLIESGVCKLPNFKIFNIISILISLILFNIKLYKLVKDKKINVIRAEDPLINGLLGLFYAKILKTKLVTCVWGNPDLIRSNSNKPMMRFLFHKKIEESIEKFVLLRADNVFVTCKDDMDFVMKKGVKKNKVKFYSITTAIEKCHFSTEAQKYSLREINEKNFNLVCVSRLEKLKNIQDLIYTMNILCKKSSLYHLYFVGIGSYQNRLMELTQKYDLEGNIHFLGNKSQKWICKFIRSVDLIISPLTGRALLEGLLSGTTIVAYDVNIHKDYIINKVNGFLVENRNYQSLAEKIIYLNDNRNLITKVGAIARQDSLIKFNREKNIKIQQEIFKVIIEN